MKHGLLWAVAVIIVWSCDTARPAERSAGAFRRAVKGSMLNFPLARASEVRSIVAASFRPSR